MKITESKTIKDFMKDVFCKDNHKKAWSYLDFFLIGFIFSWITFIVEKIDGLPGTIAAIIGLYFFCYSLFMFLTRSKEINKEEEIEIAFMTGVEVANKQWKENLDKQFKDIMKK